MSRKVKVHRVGTTLGQDITLIFVLILGGAAAVGLAIYAVNEGKKAGENAMP